MIAPLRVMITILAGFAFAGTVGSCTSQQITGPERKLAAAGFLVWYADTPPKLANLKALTQRRLVAHPYDGGIRYVYADAEGCKCLYTGNQLAYDEYQRIAAGDVVRSTGVMASEMNKDAAMDWGVWGP
jgi:hypothetical protein